MNPPPHPKIFTPEQCGEWVRECKAAGLRVGFTCGSFDLMHAGHAHYLAEARKLCDRLLVAVNSDDSIRAYKNPLRPVNPWCERAWLVASLEPVDAVTVLDETRPLSLLLRWKPDLYIKGGDYAAGSLRSGKAVEEYGGRVAVIPPAFAASTSSMIARIHALAAHAEPEAAPPRPARGLVMLDRDGTLIRNIPFLHDPGKVELLSGVAEGLAALQRAGYRLAIVTNQQGIGLGYFGIGDFIAVNQRLLGLLHEHGIAIWKIYFCPHSLADECECRKPRPGMIARAMREAGAAAADCFVVGDSLADLEAARAAGCRAVLTGSEGREGADFAAPDFSAAAAWILSRP